MKNEFEKLDAFMKQHQPTLAAPRLPLRPKTRSWWMPLAAGAFAVAIVVGINIHSQRAQLNEEALASVEALEWDMADEELSTEVTDLVALAD